MEVRHNSSYKFAIFGGAFNPPHNGHIFIVNEILQLIDLERIIVVPTGLPPSIFIKEELEDKLHRLNMVKLAFKNYNKVEISDYELLKNTTSYYIETIEHFLNREKCEKCFTIIGEDQLLQFDKWKEYKEILKRTELIAIKRIFKENALLINSISDEIKGKIRFFIDHPFLELSSTYIRKRIKENKSLETLLPENIIKYIEINKLYG